MKNINALLRSVFLALAAGLLSAGSALAADAFGPPAFIDYQGRVIGSDDNPLGEAAPTNYEMEFRLYDEPVGGIVVWAEKQLVTVSKGEFSVRLGEGQPILIPAGGGSTEGTVDHLSPGLPGAFNGDSRHLGVTVNIFGQTPAEINPRLAFLSSPFSFVAASAGKLTQADGTTSDLTVGSIAYATEVLNASALLSISNRTTLVNASTNLVIATLPQAGAFKEILVAKTDASLNQVVVAPPAGGNLNGATDPIRLKVKGESVTLQNVGGNDWWIVSERRDTTPVGSIISFAGNGPAPAGYLICDGTEVLRTVHADLFAAISTTWGTSNPSVFNLPNLEGRFLRGVGVASNGADDEATGRFRYYTAGAIGRNVGSYQNEGYLAHNHGGVASGGTSNGGAHSHNVSMVYHAATSGGFGTGRLQTTDRSPGTSLNPSEIQLSTEGAHTHTASVNINSDGGQETRPDNAGVRYCIKY